MRRPFGAGAYTTPHEESTMHTTQTNTHAGETMGVGVVLTHAEIRTIRDALAHRIRYMADGCDEYMAAGRADMAEMYARWRDEAMTALQKIRAL